MLVAEYENQAHDLVFVFLQVHYISVYISTETLATDYYKKERIIIIIIIAPKLHFTKQISLWISSASSPRYKFTIYLLQISLLFDLKSSFYYNLKCLRFSFCVGFEQKHGEHAICRGASKRISCI